MPPQSDFCKSPCILAGVVLSKFFSLILESTHLLGYLPLQ